MGAPGAHEGIRIPLMSLKPHVFHFSKVLSSLSRSGVIVANFDNGSDKSRDVVSPLKGYI